MQIRQGRPQDDDSWPVHMPHLTGTRVPWGPAPWWAGGWPAAASSRPAHCCSFGAAAAAAVWLGGRLGLALEQPWAVRCGHAPPHTPQQARLQDALSRQVLGAVCGGQQMTGCLARGLAACRQKCIMCGPASQQIARSHRNRQHKAGGWSEMGPSIKLHAVCHTLFMSGPLPDCHCPQNSTTRVALTPAKELTSPNLRPQTRHGTRISEIPPNKKALIPCFNVVCNVRHISQST